MAEAKYKKSIIFISFFLPIAVAALFGVNLRDLGVDIEPLTFLPPVYASINGLTSVLLVVAVLAIKNGKRKLHEGLMKTNIGLSILFLLLYIAYHMTSNHTIFGDLNNNGFLEDIENEGVGITRYLYYFVLISHILLSIVIIPLVLITYVRTLSKEFDKHKKIAKITFPLWLYVAVSGVIVYLMISPYYV
jgi:putative membrane protein